MGFSSYTKSLKNFISNLSLSVSHTYTTSNNVVEDDEFHPSPSLVLLPDQLFSKSSINRDHLPVVQYSTRSPELNEEEDEDNDEAAATDEYSCCAVCLSRIEAWHNVRELANCSHAFHAECLDSWMDHGHATCPVCRAKLGSGHGGGKDPWRSERMVYLFGEDCAIQDANFSNY
ncbi:hypothetical protein C2S51_025377 [Perilla frutescens var. frutescens]|nr:hypothetical protein C2S51_025377 [Perilla frutescens var. frutescens]